MIIELEPYFSIGSNTTSQNKGTSVPPWLNNETTISKWYKNKPIDFFYNTVQESENKYTLYIQYGQDNNEWASARFIAQTVEVLDEKLNNDNSITATVDVKSLFFKGVKNAHAVAGWSVNTTIKTNNQLQYNYKGNTYANYSYGSRANQTFTVTVPASSRSARSAFEWTNVYPNGEAETTRIYIGFALKNNYKPAYKPLAIRKSNLWKSINQEKGFIQIRVDNQWNERSLENYGTVNQENKGHNRIRKSSKWLQIPPFE